MKKAPSPFVSLMPIIVLVLLLFATIRTFGSDALSGGSQVSLLTTTAICILIGMVFYKIPWKDYELAITNNIAGVATAIIILLIIGALSGIWMISGVRENALYSFLNLLYIYLTPILSFHLINKIFIFHLQYYLSTFT